jgi:hypothetical protein
MRCEGQRANIVQRTDVAPKKMSSIQTFIEREFLGYLIHFMTSCMSTHIEIFEIHFNETV